MTAAWVTIALLVLGVPLLAFWVGGRRFWGRLEARAANDPASEIMRRHGLTTGEAAAVVDAVTRGAALEDRRQRAAAVELAELTSRQLYPTWDEASNWRRVGLVFTVLWVLLVVGSAVFTAVFRGLGEVSWLHLVWVAAVVGPPLVQGAKLRKTIALNATSGDEGDPA